MRLLFITSSFESGKDGVADYTFLLARECEKLGSKVAVLAWKDSYIENISQLDKGRISQLRLPKSLHAKERKKISKDFISNFHPDCVSIQMVSFGFHTRGFVFGLGEALKEVIPVKTKVEVMLHELWLGLATNHPIKEKIYGYIQRMALCQFLRQLKPDVLHVGNNIYFSKLNEMGYNSRYLPLPSNIPVQKEPDSKWIYQELSLNEQRENYVIFLFFGSIHSDWETDAFFQLILQLFGKKKIIVVSVGGQGNGKALWESIVINWATIGKIEFFRLGFRHDNEISALLQFVDFGVCTTPLSLFGKSGTAMAMIEHGLPIIVTRDELVFDFEIQNVQEEYKNVYLWNMLESSIEVTKGELIKDRCGKIAQLFLKDLALSNKK